MLEVKLAESFARYLENKYEMRVLSYTKLSQMLENVAHHLGALVARCFNNRAATISTSDYVQGSNRNLEFDVMDEHNKRKVMFEGMIHCIGSD